MIEFALVIVIFALCGSLIGFIYLKDKKHNEQVSTLIRAVIAKNAAEYRDLTVAENTTIDMKPQSDPLAALGPLMDDFTAVGATDGDTFDKMIKHANEDPEEENTQDYS